MKQAVQSLMSVFNIETLFFGTCGLSFIPEVPQIILGKQDSQDDPMQIISISYILIIGGMAYYAADFNRKVLLQIKKMY